jgi:hypothetical protein
MCSSTLFLKLYFVCVGELISVAVPHMCSCTSYVQMYLVCVAVPGMFSTRHKIHVPRRYKKTGRYFMHGPRRYKTTGGKKICLLIFIFILKFEYSYST